MSAFWDVYRIQDVEYIKTGNPVICCGKVIYVLLYPYFTIGTNYFAHSDHYEFLDLETYFKKNEH